MTPRPIHLASWMFKTWTGLALAMILSGASWAQGSSLRVHDLRALRSQSQSIAAPRLVLPLQNALRDGGSWVESALGRTEEERPDLEQLVDDLMEEVGGEQAMEEEKLRIELSSGILYVHATDEIHEQIGRRLAHLRDHLSATVNTEVYLLGASDLSTLTTSVLGAGEVQAFRSGGRQPILAGQLLNGRQCRLSATKSESWVGSFDIEVAQEAIIGDPSVGVLRTGSDLNLRVFPAPEGRIFVQVQVSASESLGTKTHELGGSPGGRIELPRVHSVVAAGEATLENGGGMVIGSTDGPGLYLISLTRVGPAANLPRALHCAPLITSPVPASPPVVTSPLPTGVTWDGLTSEFSCDTDLEGPIDLGALQDLIVREFPETFDESGSSIRFMGTTLIVRADGEVERKAGELIVGLTEATAETRQIEVAYGRLVDRPSRDGETLAGALPHRGVLSARSGFRTTLAAGVETAIVGEMSVEIASKAIGSTPRIESLFSGLVFTAQASPANQGRFALAGELTWQDAKGPPRSFDPNSDAVGFVELNALDQTESAIRVNVEAGVWTRIHTVKIAGSEDSFVLMVRVR